MAGNGIITSGVPAQTVIYGSNKEGSVQTISLSGNGQTAAVVYAPNSEVSFKGGGNTGQFLGSIVANTVKLTGNSVFFFDEALKAPTDETGTPKENGPVIESWEETFGVNFEEI